MRTEQALQEFLASRMAANLSKSTIEWYKDRLLPFARTTPSLPRRPEPVESFLATIQGSSETRYDVYRALKTFFRFISSRRHLPDPMPAVVKIQRPKSLMPTLEVGELTRLLYASETPRDKAIITLLIDCGVRAGEICSLLKHNIKQETIIVHGKVGWREVPVSAETLHLLHQIAIVSPDEYVFHGQNGPMSRHLIYEIVRRILEKAGIKGPKMGPHRLRHAFGKNFLVQGGDLRSLQEIMGHTDVKTTQKYVTLNLTDIVRKHQKFSPLRAAHAAAQESLFDTSAALREAETIVQAAREAKIEGEDHS